MDDKDYIVEKRFKSNYLSKSHYSRAWDVVICSLFLMLFFSLARWYPELGLGASYLAANFELLKEGEIWRLFTTMFVHGDAGHLVANSFLFSVFGYYIISFFGIRHFVFASLVFGALTNLLTLYNMNPQTYLVGASGVVYFLGGFWLMIYLFIERNRNIAQRIVRSLGVAVVLFGPTQFSPQTSYAAHGWGFLIGLAYAPVYFYFNKTYIRSFEKYRLEVFEDIGIPPKEFQ